MPFALLFLTACATEPPAPDPYRDGGLLWVKHSAEYRALTEQVYAKATSDLPGFIADTSWSVIPGQDDAAEEIEIARVFAGQAVGRAKRNFRKIDDNDDELVKNIAESTYERGGYGWDVL